MRIIFCFLFILASFSVFAQDTLESEGWVNWTNGCAESNDVGQLIHACQGNGQNSIVRGGSLSLNT